ncbi:MAG: hypothetical protein NTW19_18135 [Planctomycetota bacterium]|nr:hypothetical protein [Planctomycetota bacterium]
MPAPAPSAPAPLPQRGPFAIVVGSFLLLLAGLWLAQQDGPFPASPDSFARALLILLGAAPLVVGQWIAAAGLGWLIRRVIGLNGPYAWVAQLGAGLAALLMLDAGLGLAGMLNAYTAWGLVILGAGLLAWQASQPENRRRLQGTDLPAPPWAILAAAPSLGILLVACACPVSTLWRIEAYGYDVLSYHLQLPREWLAMGHIAGLKHNVYSYLPNLVEAGYMAIGAMAGSMVEGVYAAQMFHASAAVFAAVAVGATVDAAIVAASPEGALVDRSMIHSRQTTAGLAGALLLAMPWTLFVGSLAYDEMFALAFAAAATTLLFSPFGPSFRGAAMIGFLAGAAALAKLPMGPMIALPLGLALLLGLNRGAWLTSSLANRTGYPSRADIKFTSITLAAVALLTGLLTLSPYFIRNAMWTADANHLGNPVFPFAAKTLGSAHWTPTEVDRWNAAHGHASDGASPLHSLDRQWLRNPGYGAVGGSPPSFAGKDRFNIARFQREFGFPLLWLAAAAGAVAALSTPRLRRPALAMLLMLACQIAFWLLGTHQQSRFLVPSLLPQAVLIGLLLERLASRGTSAKATPPESPLAKTPLIKIRRAAAPALGVALVAACAFNNLQILGAQTIADLKVWQLTGSLLMPDQLDRAGDDMSFIGNSPISQLPPDSLTYSLADCSRLLFIRRRVLYETAFDRCLLGDLSREHHGDPLAVTAALRARGVTHLWVAWFELDRLHQTYGFDPDVTTRSVAELTKGWRVVTQGDNFYTLFALPR